MPPAASVEGWPVRYRIIVCLPLALYPSCRCCTSQSQGFSSIPISYRANPRSGLDEFVLRIPVPYQKAPGTQCSRQRLCVSTTVKCFYSGLCAAQSLSQPCCTCVATFNTVVDAANAFFLVGRIADKALFSSPFCVGHGTAPERYAFCFFLARAHLVQMEERQLRTLQLCLFCVLVINPRVCTFHLLHLLWSVILADVEPVRTDRPHASYRSVSINNTPASQTANASRC